MEGRGKGAPRNSVGKYLGPFYDVRVCGVLQDSTFKGSSGGFGS